MIDPAEIVQWLCGLYLMGIMPTFVVMFVKYLVNGFATRSWVFPKSYLIGTIIWPRTWWRAWQKWE
jgi:hypothetical protein